VRASQQFTYSSLQKLAHWAIVCLCVAEFPTASAIRRTHHVNPLGFKPAAADLFFHNVHAWSGWLILLLAAILLSLRVVRGAPALPAGMTRLERGLARQVVGHRTMIPGSPSPPAVLSPCQTSHNQSRRIE
jgi:cytochrome b561